ncbi:Calmodulin-3 [Borealophlyctis nickersoniae]|nr:Calmodulin-3 [Borealophlyctis nickersoniae]
MPPRKKGSTSEAGAPDVSSATRKGRRSVNAGGSFLPAPGSSGGGQRANIAEEPSSSHYLRVDPTLSARTGISEAELQELVEIFSLVDIDHGGTISKDELAQLMKTLGLRVSQVELATMVNEIDVAGTGEIDFESFVTAVSRKVQTSMTAEDLRKAFKVFDNDDPGHDGTLGMQTLISIMTDWGDEKARLAKDEAEDLISQVMPQAQTGIFDYLQFIRMYFGDQ